MMTVLRIYKTCIISAVMLAGAALICTAQPTPGSDRQLFDGVAAVVGNEVVLYSDIQQQLALMAQQDPSINPRDPALRKQALESMVDERLVLVRAQEDSVTVNEDEVMRYTDYRIQQIIAQVGSEKRVEEVFGYSMQRIKSEARDMIRRQLIIQRAQQARLAAIKLTDHDVQEFYKNYKDTLPAVPEQVELQRILLKSKPGATAKAGTVSLAKAIIDSIRNGADFADFAKRYSADPGSARNGGDLGFVAPGKFVKEFEEAAKKLKLNEISDPVETQFGFHIIQVLERRSDGTHSRHILLPVKQSTAERDSMLALLRDLKRRALGGENFADLARQYSQDDDTRALGGLLGKTPPDQLPPDVKARLDSMKTGDVSDPMEAQISPTEGGIQIIRLNRIIPSHKMDPVEDRQILERYAMVYKQRSELTNWIAELRKDIYWEIRPE